MAPASRLSEGHDRDGQRHLRQSHSAHAAEALVKNMMDRAQYVPGPAQLVSLHDGGCAASDAEQSEQQRDRLEELLAQMGLETVRQNKAYTLSGGERRRLEIARSLTLQPSFILLDEPFSGIDPLTVKDLQETIRQLSRSGIGVLITDHNVRETLSVTDRAYILRNGKIFRKGRPAELSNDPEVRRVYLGDHFRLN